jgi:multidrug efflux system membrane fusion protein
MTEKSHPGQTMPDTQNNSLDIHRQRKRVLGSIRLFTIAIVLLMLFGLGKTLFDRWKFGDVLAARAAEAVLLHVYVTKPESAAKLGPEFTKFKLPGTLQGITEAQIYARVNGYVKAWNKDIGSPVKKGDVLAVLDVPEVVKQVEEAQANYNLAKIAYERWTRLRQQDAVSQQELDEKTALFKQTEAILKRLKEQLGFSQVLAPFDGIITKRNVNLGDLVNAGNGGTAQAMFNMARVDKLHVYAYLPQDRADDVKVGDEVELFRTNSPDKPIKGKIARTAGAIDTTTRTMQIDVEVPNEDQKLLPGTYVDVMIKVDPGSALVLPTNTLLFGPAGAQVAIVRDNKVVRQDVKLGIDYGQLVQVRSGVTKNDLLIVNPPDSIAAGQEVVIETPRTKGNPGK